MNMHNLPDNKGYILHPPRRPSDPGYSQLDVVFRSEPTGFHFDPEAMRLMVVYPHGGVDQLKVAHPWISERRYQVCPGQIDLSDRFGKKVEAFTFGGVLSIEPVDEKETFCSLQSLAPILLYRSLDAIPTLLAQESEILLAERRAVWGHDPDTFDQRLAALDPQVFYVTCLEAILARFDHLPGPDDEIRKFRHVLHTEITALQENGRGQVVAKRLEDIL
jgi:hypothetical protein